MKFLTARSRITIGLVGLLVSIICGAIMIGIVPERDSAVRMGRADLCETIAISSSDYISRDELDRLAHLIKSVVERNDDVLSAGVRKSNGDLVTDIGNHAAGWPRQATERSTGTHVNVPIQSGQEKWGNVELRFRMLQKPGLIGYWENPWLQMTVFVVGVSYIVFFVYLGKMLQHLDPSKTVPKRVRSALDSLAEGLLVIDKDQRIVLANFSFSNWVGRPAEKLVGVQAAKLNWVKNQQNEPLEEYPWVEAIRLESPQVGVVVGLAHKNEPTQILMANASPVLGHDGKYRGVLVSFDDVTQLEETKRDLKVAKKVAETANQAKSEFLARMSHEIRTPMNAILGYTDVLRRGFDESVENRHEYLDTIHSSGEHLLALINDILDLSKVEAGQMELELEHCSPHKLISQVVRLLRPKADEKGISLEIRCDDLLPETILVDSVRLRQTIMNLAGNAIKFTETVSTQEGTLDMHNIAGLGMGGDLTVDQSVEQDGSGNVTFSGGISYDGLEVVEVLLGTGNDTFIVESTAEDSVTVIHGGGNSFLTNPLTGEFLLDESGEKILGGDAITVNGGGGPTSPLVI